MTGSHSQGELLLPWHLGTGLRQGGDHEFSWVVLKLRWANQDISVSQENNAKQLSCASLV